MTTSKSVATAALAAVLVSGCNAASDNSSTVPAASLRQSLAASSSLASSFSDDFEADPIGSFPMNWTNVAGTSKVCEGLSKTHELCPTTTETIITPTFLNPALTDYTVEASVTHESSDGGIGILGRYRDSTHFYGIALVTGPLTASYENLEIWKHNGNEITSFRRDVALHYYLPTGDDRQTDLKVIFIRTVFYVFVNTRLIATVHDSTFPSGSIALHSAGTINSTIDNVIVTPSAVRPTPTPIAEKAPAS